MTRLAEQFPQFQLEDKLGLMRGRGGIDKLTVPLAYVQRKQRTAREVRSG